jgi:hypothetical protein
MIRLPRGTSLVFAVGVLALFVSGCASPEDGRHSGGGPGADGGNYHGKPIHAPSKIDGTRPVPYPFPLPTSST